MASTIINDVTATYSVYLLNMLLLNMRRLLAYFRRQLAPTPIDRHSDVRRPTFQ